MRGRVRVVEVAVATSLRWRDQIKSQMRMQILTNPDATGFPVVGHGEGNGGVCISLPSGDNTVCQRRRRGETRLTYPVAKFGTALPAFKSVNIYREDEYRS